MDNIYDSLGYDDEGYDRNGYDRNGFNREGIHRETKGRYSPMGFDRDGFDKDGFDRHGYDIKGFNRRGYDRSGYDKEGYDRNGFNRKGFNRDGIHNITRTKYDKNGFDQNGYDANGYNKKGYDVEGYDENGLDRNGKSKVVYDDEGYDRNGYDENGFNRDGRDRYGYDREGYNVAGYDRYGKDKDGYDKDGYKDGYDREGYNRAGFNREGIHRETQTRYGSDGFDRGGYDEEGYDRKGYSRSGFDRKGHGRAWGADADISTLTEDSREVKIVREFLDSKMTKNAFLKSKGFSEKDFDRVLQAVYFYSEEIGAEIKNHLSENSRKYLSYVNGVSDSLAKGEISVEDYIRRGIPFKDLVNFSSEENKEQVYSLVLSKIVSGELTMFQYIKIFGDNEKSVLENVDIVRSSVEGVIRTCKNREEFKDKVKILYKELERIKGYKTLYKFGDESRVGYFDPESKKTFSMEVTQEKLELAKAYVRYVCKDACCYYNVHSALMGLVKGEWSEKDVEEAKNNHKKSYDAKATDTVSEDDRELENLVTEYNSKKEELSEINERIENGEKKVQNVRNIINELMPDGGKEGQTHDD